FPRPGKGALRGIVAVELVLVGAGVIEKRRCSSLAGVKERGHGEDGDDGQGDDGSKEFGVREIGVHGDLLNLSCLRQPESVARPHGDDWSMKQTMVEKTFEIEQIERMNQNPHRG